MTSDHVFVALSTFVEHDPAPLEALKRSGFSYSVHDTGKRITREELTRDGVGADVIIAGVEPYDEAVLSALPRLRCISRCGAGVDSVDLEEARRRGITVVNTPDIPAVAVAELALTMMLSLSRNLRLQQRLFAEHQWKRVEAHTLRGRTVGIVGLGRIGRRVAALLAPFGARILAHDPVADPAWAASQSIELTTLEALLSGSDIVSIHAASGGAARLRIGAEDLGSMRRGALLLNLARGGMVDEQALEDALRSGHLAGAGLDVFGEEPYSGPLCDLDNVILTPHSATMTVETRAEMEAECVDKALRFLRGELTAGERVV